MTAALVATVLLPATVLVPLAAAVLLVLLPARARRVAGMIAAVLTAGLGVAVATGVGLHGALTVELGGNAPPLGIALRADGIAAAFLLLLAVVGPGVSLHAAAHPPATGTGASRGWFWPTWLLAWAGLAAVMVSGDLFNLYVGLELVGLAAVLLVALGGRPAWSAAFRYLVVAVGGSLLFLLALTLVYATTGTLDLVLAGQRLADSGPGPHTSAILALTLAGMALKTAVFPLHGWLPGAHGNAPTVVSPLLSALVVKASFVVAVRVWTEVTGPDPVIGAVIGAAASGSVIWGGILALRATHLKRLVAYSTISQVGYLFLFFPLDAATGGDPAATGAVLAAVVTLALAHGLNKSSLFLSAGILKDHLGTDRIDTLTARGADLPLISMAMGLAAVGLAGLPITLGFAGKWQLLLAAVDLGAWWAVVVLALGTLLAMLYLLRPLQALLTGGSEEGIDASPDRDRPALPPMILALPLLLALTSVAATFVASPLARLITTTVAPGGV